MILFFVFHSPFALAYFLNALSLVWDIVIGLVWINSFINPVIYCCHSNFRVAYKKTV